MPKKKSTLVARALELDNSRSSKFYLIYKKKPVQKVDTHNLEEQTFFNEHQKTF
jgi:hypothetical protein